MQDILIVEDDQQILRALSRSLARRGYTVATAPNGKQALADLEQAEPLPLVIIADLMMPVMDGWQFRHRLLAHPRWAGIPVIILSGSGCDESAAKLPGVRYVAKPVPLQALYESVALAMGRPPVESRN